MVTPLLENGELDKQGLRNIVAYMMDGGVHGLFLLGTTGEGPSLSRKLRKQLVSEACELINKQLPVLVGITDTSVQESLELAHHAKKAGADVLVVAPPYYFPISQEEIQGYLEHLVPQLPLPFLLYNMPSCTKLWLSLETVKKARELGAIGIKDSSGDLAYLHALLDEFGQDPSFSIITGTESFLPDLLAKGGHGTVAGGANFFPRMFVGLYEACLGRDEEKISIFLNRVQSISDTIYSVGKGESKYVKGTKCALSVMGLCHDQVAPPLQRFNAVERGQITTYMDGFPPDSEHGSMV